MTFKIGDDIIMTADSGKGEVFIIEKGNTKIPTSGEYRATVIESSNTLGYTDQVWVKIEGIRGEWHFNPGGSCPTHPGMSIRPAKITIPEKGVSVENDQGLRAYPGFTITYSVGAGGGAGKGEAFIVGSADDEGLHRCEKHKTISTGTCIYCDKPADEGKGGMLNYIKKDTPSQWIDGKAPAPRVREGDIVIWGALFDEPLYISKYEEIHREVEYTHWQYVQLPPPPPAKEVEAFGILEWLKYEPRGRTVDEITKATAFFSQPATAENLNKYIDCMHKIYNYDGTIDQFINWHKEQHSEKLLFTPAALDELGMK